MNELEITKEPSDLISRACDAAMKAADETLASAGAKTKLMLVVLEGEDMPSDEATEECVAMHGIDIPEDATPRDRAKLMLEMLLVQSHVVAQALDLNFSLVPIKRKGFG